MARSSSPCTALDGRLRRLTAALLRRLARSGGWLRSALVRASQLLATSVDPVWVLLLYFVSNSVVGFLLLKTLPSTSREGTIVLGDLDLFFTSVSAVTASSMSTVEMEALSRGQLAVVVLLMLVGGEVFTSMIQLHLAKARLPTQATDKDGNNLQIELGSAPADSPADVEAAADAKLEVGAMDSDRGEVLEYYRSINILLVVVFWYNAVFLLLGSAAVFLYLVFFPGAGDARDVLRKKGIHLVEFSVFHAVSSFTNCGFLPTNESMFPFRKNSGLLLLITAPLVLAGNTLFPACLRAALWVTRGYLAPPEGRSAELIGYLLNGAVDGRRIGFRHVLGRSRCVYLVLTAAAFLAVQFVVFCCMDWSSAAADMSATEKAAAALFQSVNCRHAGESVFDLSSLSPALVALYVIMMYLPPYTTLSPAGDEAAAASISSNGQKKKKRRRRWLPERVMLSQLAWIAVFVVLVCITERRKLAGDPLNFNVFTVVVEVVSAYGNVGLSTGYSCGRRLRAVDGDCKDRWYGFAGRWSDTGKLLLIAVMLFGRLKKFNEREGTAWKLS